jgi:hypothetical protein
MVGRLLCAVSAAAIAMPALVVEDVADSPVLLSEQAHGAVLS